jgi:glycosyltransferase involved in cell wall biosynthesis
VAGLNVIPPRGGSDILEEGLRKRINFDDYNVNLILSRCTEDQIVDGKINILWQHLNYNEPLTRGMSNKFFTRAIDGWVYVSHWQHEKFRYVYDIPVSNANVIKNAIDPIEYLSREINEKIRLIYTSAPFRGLDILLDSFEALGRDDVELHVYSSTIIYGSDYDREHYDIFSALFERAENMKNVIYHGYAPNEEIRSALQQAHIFAYPSMFEETCCLAMIEAGAAGCRLVSHNLGALAETGAEFATLAPIQIDRQRIIERYSSILGSAIDSYVDYVPMLKQQSDYFNYFYSWEKKIVDWTNFLNSFNI